MARTIAWQDDRDERVVSKGFPLPTALGVEYETVAASQLTQFLGVTGVTGDMLVGLLVTPTAPNPASIKDGTGSAITVFAGGVTSVQNLTPFYLKLGVKSVTGGWQLTTGANVSVLAIGNFT